MCQQFNSDIGGFGGNDRAHQGRQAARAGGNDRNAIAGAAGRADAGEFLPSFEASGWQGLGAPKNTPPEIIDTLNRAVDAALVDPNFARRLADLATSAMPMTPAEYGNFIAGGNREMGEGHSGRQYQSAVGGTARTWILPPPGCVPPQECEP